MAVLLLLLPSRRRFPSDAPLALDGMVPPAGLLPPMIPTPPIPLVVVVVPTEEEARALTTLGEVDDDRASWLPGLLPPATAMHAALLLELCCCPRRK